MTSLQDHLDNNTVYCPTTGCKLWLGPTDESGYARTTINRKHQRIHRPVMNAPAGLVVDHKCRVRNCVRPEHLRVVTARENALENSDSPCAVNARKTRCPKCDGPYTILDTRRCVPCRKALTREKNYYKREPVT